MKIVPMIIDHTLSILSLVLGILMTIGVMLEYKGVEDVPVLALATFIVLLGLRLEVRMKNG